MRAARRGCIAVLAMLSWTSLAHAQEAPRPAHPAMRYSCMSDPPPGYAWPWVAAGVPMAIEVLHPGWGIDHYDAFTISGMQLFSIAGMRRSEAVSERYADVEAVDAQGAVVTGRALFLRSIEGVTDAYAMALRAMAIVMRRADERPLRSAPAGIDARVRDRIAAPRIEGRVLTFWIRNRADLPYASPIEVELDTGIVHGNPS